MSRRGRDGMLLMFLKDVPLTLLRIRVPLPPCELVSAADCDRFIAKYGQYSTAIVMFL